MLTCSREQAEQATINAGTNHCSADGNKERASAIARVRVLRIK
jgi:hypothetical protein